MLLLLWNNSNFKFDLCTFLFNFYKFPPPMFYSFFSISSFLFLVWFTFTISYPLIFPFMFSLFCLILVVHFSLPRFFFLSCHYFLLFVLLVRPHFYLKNSLLTVSFVSSKNQQKRKFSSKLSQKKNQAKLKHYYISYGNLHIFSNVSVTVKWNQWEYTDIPMLFYCFVVFLCHLGKVLVENFDKKPTWRLQPSCRYWV